MSSQSRRRPSPGLVVAVVALIFALGGSAVAASGPTLSAQVAKAVRLSKSANKNATRARKTAAAATKLAKQANANSKAALAGAASAGALAKQASTDSKAALAAAPVRVVKSVAIPASGQSTVTLFQFGPVTFTGTCDAGTTTAAGIQATTTQTGATLTSMNHHKQVLVPGYAIGVITPEDGYGEMFTLYTSGNHALSGDITVLTNPADAPGTCRFSGVFTGLS